MSRIQSPDETKCTLPGNKLKINFAYLLVSKNSQAKQINTQQQLKIRQINLQAKK